MFSIEARERGHFFWYRVAQEEDIEQAAIARDDFEKVVSVLSEGQDYEWRIRRSRAQMDAYIPNRG